MEPEAPVGDGSSVSIPWLALLVGAILLAAFGFVCGRLTISRVTADAATVEGKPAEGPNDAQKEVIRVLRHADRPVFMSELAQAVLRADSSISARAVELAAQSLYGARWIDGHRAWSGHGHEFRFELGGRGMEYAKAEGFSHARKTP